jgi:Family of unknown function (DUF6166)
MEIRGTWATRQVWVDGKELRPERSLQVRSTPPNGFAWDYGGSGPAQLALVLLLELTTEPMVLLWSQKVKWHIIAPCPRPTSPWTRR